MISNMVGEQFRESPHESLDDSKWDMHDIAPPDQEVIQPNGEGLEKDPSLSAQEKENQLREARERIEAVYREITPPEMTPMTTSAVTLPKVAPAQQKNKALRFLKRTATITGASALTFAAASATAIMPAVIPLTIPAMVFAVDSIIYNIRGVNGSMFEVNGKNRITQRLNPLPILLKHHGQTSAEIFDEEAKKLFGGLKSGETYNTRSHAMTYSLLKKAEREGYITNLTKEKSGKSRLIIESLATSNWKSILKNKKHDMYQISFKMV